MLTITFKLFTSHAPTAASIPSHERRHICYSLNFYDDGARHGFPLTLPSPLRTGVCTALQQKQQEQEEHGEEHAVWHRRGDSVLHFDDVDLRVSFKIHINFY